MTKEAKEKRVILQFGNVRIIEFDEKNFEVQAHEQVYNKAAKETVSRWRFKGYSTTVRHALGLIVVNEWGIVKSAVNDLESHLKAVKESNEYAVEAINKYMEVGKL